MQLVRSMGSKQG